MNPTNSIGRNLSDLFCNNKCDTVSGIPSQERRLRSEIYRVFMPAIPRGTFTNLATNVAERRVFWKMVRAVMQSRVFLTTGDDTIIGEDTDWNNIVHQFRVRCVYIRDGRRLAKPAA